MLSQNEIDALLRERHGYEVAGKKDRAAQVDAVLRAGGHIEAAAKPSPAPVGESGPETFTPTVEAAVKRGPGRPRKGD